MLAEPPILRPGTVEDLVADARLMGRKATQRMIMDWQTFGLIDYPAPQGGAGRGQGSKKSLYSVNQRLLFREVIRKRGEVKKVAGLTVVPVGIWLYWGQEYVPTRQVQLALKTFVKTFMTPSLDRAKLLADQLVQQIAHPDATSTQRAKMARLVAATIYSGEAPDDETHGAIAAAFDPHEGGRVLGPPGARVSPDNIVDSASVRELATRALVEDRVRTEMLERVRVMQMETLREYQHALPAMAAAAGDLSTSFDNPTLEYLINESCSHVVSLLGYALREAGNDE